MTENGRGEIARVERNEIGLVRPVATAADVVSAHQQVTELIKKALVPGEDYGKVPGTDKETLLKPGAERLAIAFGASPRYVVEEKEIDHDRPVKFTKRRWEWGQKRGEKIWHTEEGESQGLYRYVVRCVLERADGRVLGEAVGACSTMESKYVDAPRNAENTVLKMACKRALVAAVLNAFGLSNRFTQDMEESREHVEAEVVREPPKPRKASLEQKRVFFADARTRLRWSDDVIKEWLRNNCGLDNTNDITFEVMDAMVKKLAAIEPEPQT